MAMTTTEAPPDDQREVRRGWLAILPGLIIAMLLAQLDNVVVGTAMPRIVGELGGLAHLSWVVTAYTLAATVSTPLYGKLGDLYGRKKLFVFAIVVFLGGSMLSGAAQSMLQLIVFRAIQGLGAGGLIVSVMAIIGELVPPRERGRMQGYFGSVMAISMIGGPLLGGFVTDHWSWRWAFYINLPLGAVALVLVITTLHLPSRTNPHRIDYLGAALLTAGITAIVLVTTWGGTQYAWGSATIIGLAAFGVLALGGFGWVETHVPEPILPLQLFRNRNFSAIAGVTFVSGFAMFGAITFLPLFMQIVQGASATNSGVLLIPLMIGALVGSQSGGQLITRTGRYKPQLGAGAVLMTGGLLLLTTLDASTSKSMTIVFMVVLGLGIGLLMPVTMIVAQSSVEMKDIGVASSTSAFFRTIGGSFGVALAGAIFSARLGLGGGSAFAQLNPVQVQQLPAPARAAIGTAVSHAIQGVFWWSAAVAAVAIVLTFVIRSLPLRGLSGPAAADEQPELVDAL
jgi:EmrB/QacA subfamily drug resistance transporter